MAGGGGRRCGHGFVRPRGHKVGRLRKDLLFPGKLVVPQPQASVTVLHIVSLSLAFLVARK